jgi:hypothetical protein
MQTHYVRRAVRHNVRFATPLESLVYSRVPSDRLVTRPDVLDDLRGHLARHPDEGPFDAREAEGAVATLAERGFLKEVHGVRLERWLETF